jgi:beta-glucosidase
MDQPIAELAPALVEPDRLPAAFPAEFVWGAATAAYQIEGAASADGRGESIWDRFAHTPGRVANGDTGDVACDHYHRWREDVALMQQLGLHAYRFSIAWPRVLPNGRGAPNERGLAFYERLVDGLLVSGITPWVTLYHWDLPQALEDAGGWPRRETAHAFADYADLVSRRLGDRVRHWITINEPWCAAFLGYHSGVHAPGHTSLPAAVAAAHSLLLAHGLAVQVLRRNVPGARVGIALSLNLVYPATASPADRAAAARLDGYYNRWFLDPLYGRGYPSDLAAQYGADPGRQSAPDLAAISAPADFLGVNYYAPTIVRDAPDAPFLQAEHVSPPHGEYTHTGWLVHPDTFYRLLRRLHTDYRVPSLCITENGAAYPDPEPNRGRVADPQRTRYLACHLAALHRALADGVPVEGYFAWSLMDNFEWAEGYRRRFGLTYVDYATQTRTIKDSGHWYSRAIRANALPPLDPPPGAPPPRPPATP